MKNITQYPQQDLTVEEWRAAVAVHELGHQIGRLVHEPQNHSFFQYNHEYYCIMNDGCGSGANNPLFCPGCVKYLRWSTIYF